MHRRTVDREESDMAGYPLLNATVTDPDGYEEYRSDDEDAR